MVMRLRVVLLVLAALFATPSVSAQQGVNRCAEALRTLQHPARCELEPDPPDPEIEWVDVGALIRASRNLIRTCRDYERSIASYRAIIDDMYPGPRPAMNTQNVLRGAEFLEDLMDSQRCLDRGLSQRLGEAARLRDARRQGAREYWEREIRLLQWIQAREPLSAASWEREFALHDLVTVAWSYGDRRLVEASAQDFFQQYPESLRLPEVALVRALNAFEVGAYADARAILTPWMDSFQRATWMNAQAWLLRARISYEVGEHTDALDALNLAIGLSKIASDASSPPTLLSEASAELLRTARTLWPVYRAQAALTTRRFEGLEADVSRFAESVEERAAVLDVIADRLRRRGRWRESAALYEASMRSAPEGSVERCVAYVHVRQTRECGR